MPQDRDQYVHFTIKLLKGSFALNALWQDALNYHMIDQPDKLIALRLTEYYELISRGDMRPGPTVQGALSPSPAPMGNNAVPPSLPANPPAARQITSQYQAQSKPAEPARFIDPSNDIVVSSSLADTEQMADDAADYWSPL